MAVHKQLCQGCRALRWSCNARSHLHSRRNAVSHQILKEPVMGPCSGAPQGSNTETPKAAATHSWEPVITQGMQQTGRQWPDWSLGCAWPADALAALHVELPTDELVWAPAAFSVQPEGQSGTEKPLHFWGFLHGDTPALGFVSIIHRLAGLQAH